MKTTVKSFDIDRDLVRLAYGYVKANRGGAGVDAVSLEAFEQDLEDNLYKIWNRMASGSYRPPPVRQVEIPKGDTGKLRQLGIPTVADRIAQTVVKLKLDPLVEPHFHVDSYGYRRGKSAHQALAVTRQRCWRYDWVIDLDIKGFFDNLRHDLVLKALRRHTEERWILLYVERWLKAPVQQTDGSLQWPEKGSPQGSVISPVLANLFLHYGFDEWMRRNYPKHPFARYADDVVVHASSLAEARRVLEAIRERLAECGLELNPEKTKIVYCKDFRRRGDHEHISFDFLGYTFRPRRAKSKAGKVFLSFLPAISRKAVAKIRAEIRSWEISTRGRTLEEIAEVVNAKVRGWVHYYGQFYRSALREVFYPLRRALGKWALRRFKRLKGSWRRAASFLRGLVSRERKLFDPSVVAYVIQLNTTSRMN